MRNVLLTLAALATIASGQALSQASPAEDFSKARPRAAASNSFLVTWVGIAPTLRIEGTLTATVDSLEGFQYGDVAISGPWSNGKHVWYTTLKIPSDKDLTAAIKAARETWAASKAVSQTASPKERIWPLPSAGEAVDPNLSAAGPLPKGFELSEGMKRYKRAGYSQKLFGITGDPVDKIEAVHRHDLPNKDWLQSGGMLGITDFRSDLYRNAVAERPSLAVEKIIVNNGGDITHYNQFGQVTAIERGKATQPQDGYVARYPDGSRFMDVLSNTKSGAVFEIRQRLKESGNWRNSVVFTDERERPAGYTGLTKSCTSCHAQAGTGGYAVGLVPGADQTLSIGFKALEK